MKRSYIILLMTMLLFTGCESKKEEKFEELESTIKTTSTSESTTTSTSMSISSEPTTSSTNTTKSTNTSTKKTTTSTTTKKNYPVTVNGRGYEIGDTVTIDLTLKSKVYLGFANVYVYVMKPCTATTQEEKFMYLEDELDVKLKHEVLSPVQCGPDEDVLDKGYCGHGYRYQVAADGFMAGTNVKKTDFSKGVRVLRVTVKLKKAGNYKIKASSRVFQDINYNDVDSKLVSVNVSQK